MRAVGVTEFGGPECLQLVEIPEQHAGPGEIRIRVAAAGVNPTDTLTRSGGRAEALRAGGPPPYIPGMDIAGIIDEVGAEVTTGAKVGDRVMAIVRPMGGYGGYSEFVVVPARSAVPIPNGASFAEAASVPMNSLTARRALDQLGLSPGDTLFVSGAAGSFGGYTIQLAKIGGVTVIADASETDERLVASLGADIVVRRGPDVADRVLAAMPGGVDAVADGSVQGEQLYPAIKNGGGYAGVRGVAVAPPRSIAGHEVWVREYITEYERLDDIRSHIEAGAITMRVAATYPAEEASETHRLLEAGGTRGRLVIIF